MTDLSDLWNKAASDTYKSDAPKRQFDAVPSGTYNAMIERAALDMSKAPHQVSIWYKISEGEMNGRMVFANFSLNEVGTSILKKELMKLGYDGTPKSFEDLSVALSTLVGREVNVTAKHRTYLKKDGTTGDAHNVYINGGEVKTSAVVEPKFDTSEPLPF